MTFPPRFSGRYITLVLTLLLYGTLIMAVIERFSLEPLSLIGVLSMGLAVRIVAISWNGYESEKKMLKAREYAFLIHLFLCIIISASSLRGLFR